MKKQSILICCFLLGVLATSCTTSNVNNASDNSMNSLDWAGIYKGKLPCSDCQEVVAVLKINKDLTYTSETKAEGKSDEITKKTGKFTWNKAGSTITLGGADNHFASGNFAVGENNITLLDTKGNPLLNQQSEKVTLRKETNFDNTITEKYWKLIEINGRAVQVKEKLNREPHFILKQAEHKVLGTGGCNSFFGTYELKEGNRISFSKMGATQMACMDMEVEGLLFKTLERTDNYSLKNDTLQLNKARMAPLAKFVVVYLR
jgi:copper homeostasis protein (lipoprotein)